MSEPERIPLRRLIVPAEHGGWAFLGEPILLGLVLAPAWASLLLAVAVVAAFLARQPLRLFMGDRARGRRYPRTVAAERAFAVLAGLAAAALAGALLLARGPLLLALGLAAPLAALALALDLSGRARLWITELAAPLALGATPAAMLLATGAEPRMALGLWAALATRIAPTIPYLRARVRLDRGEPVALAPALLAQALGIAWAFALVRAGLAPATTVGVAVMLALRAAWGLSPWRWRTRVMVLGLLEVAFGLAAVVLLAVGVRAAR